MSPPSLIDIARLEEHRRAVSGRSIAEHVLPISSGGMAFRGRPGSWINYAVGMGLDATTPNVPRAELEGLVEWYGSAGIEPRLELTPFVGAELLRACEQLGFAARSFTNTFFRSLSPTERVQPVREPPAGLEIRLIDPRDEAMVRAYCEVAVSGFRAPATPGFETDVLLAMNSVRQPGMHAMGGWMNDGAGPVLAAAGAVHAVEGGAPGNGVASLLGLSVLTSYRRRGIQQALIAARLNFAARLGVGIATIGSRPGAATERNVRRMGFNLAYTKVNLARAGAGLIGMPG
jgi:GNAT superfamily N-acetyltransferase